jgi:two-component system sensor histidine kinase FlrB
MLLNLMRNALDAGGPGKIVDVSARDDGDAVVIEVHDTGPGFAANVLARPFAPFQTTKPGGTGLGLAIVRRIVEEHGGHVMLSNRTTGGGCVTLRLPKVSPA